MAEMNTENLGVGALERQVIEAALTTTRPASDSHERAEASRALERWTAGGGANETQQEPGAARRPPPIDGACWEAYVNIVRASFASGSQQLSQPGTPMSSPSQPSALSPGDNDVDAVERIAYMTSPQKHRPIQQQPHATAAFENHLRNEADGAKLLLLTLLSTKIRREYVRLGREHPVLAGRLREELGAALTAVTCRSSMNMTSGNTAAGASDRALMGACCTAAAAVAVRLDGAAADTIAACRSSLYFAFNLGAVNGAAAGASFSPSVALRLLSAVPEEVMLRTDLTTAEAEALLQMPPENNGRGESIASIALDAVRTAAVGSFAADGGTASDERDGLLCSSLRALSGWAEACKTINLSRLQESPPHSTSSSTSTSLLSMLVGLLSSQSQHRQWSSGQRHALALMRGARALSAVVSNATDFGTESRHLVISAMLAAIPPPVGFLSAPLAVARTAEWDDASADLSSLASILAAEEMDEVAACNLAGCSDLIELLLGLQAHPVHAAAVPVLDVWLALQDVPTSDRHAALAAPLCERLVDVLSTRVAYPPAFVSWEEELDVESSEFDEMRRLATDVLVGNYFLLRTQYLGILANVLASSDGGQRWTTSESALFCLCAVGREACARVKASGKKFGGGGSDGGPVAADGEATAAGLTQMVGSLCGVGVGGSYESAVRSRHPLVVAGLCNFIGCYALVWNASCTSETVLGLLAYLTAALSVPDAAEAAGKSIRSLLNSCSCKLATKAALAAAAAGVSNGASPPSHDHIAAALARSMEAALSSSATSTSTGGDADAKTAAHVAEGCARLCIQLRGDATHVRNRAALAALASPVLQRARSALDVVVAAAAGGPSSSAAIGQAEAASRAVASCLGVLREIVRFCDDTTSGNGHVHVLTDVLNAAWPVLNDVASSPACRSRDDILTKLLDVHGQLLSIAPVLIVPQFRDLLAFVVRAYEEAHCPSALDYIAAAVETLGSDQREDVAAAAGLDARGRETLFDQLLTHLCQCTFAYVTQVKRPNECPQVIKALFELAQRYFLFCPGALCGCSEFASFFSLAVACLAECRGEVESTRAILIFLSQLIGWKSIRLSPAALAVVERYADSIDASLAAHGETITKACIGGLSGGAPQILWPAYSDCLFAMLVHVVAPSSSPNGVDDQRTATCYRWLESAMSDSSIVGGGGGATQNMFTADVGASVIRILCGLAKEGTKSKPRTKMLLMDFGKICKGEMTPDALLAYSL